MSTTTTTDLGNISLRRKEDWRRFVETPPRTQPELSSGKELEALTPTWRARYDRRRRDWHANMGH